MDRGIGFSLDVGKVTSAHADGGYNLRIRGRLVTQIGTSDGAVYSPGMNVTLARVQGSSGSMEIVGASPFQADGG